MTTSIGILILGLVIGGLIAWLIVASRLQGKAKVAEALVNEKMQQIQKRDDEINKIRSELDAERRSKVEALTRLEESQKSFEEQKALIETMKSAALESNSENFLRRASEHLKPLHEALKRYEEQINAIEAKRRQDYGSIEAQIKMLASTHQQLSRETSSLATALRKPQVSGSWGQLSLKRTAELAGMTDYCDFYEQESVTAEIGRLRPDMIVRLPNGREIVVDAKAPVDAYLNAISVSSEEEREKALTSYVKKVRAHMNALGSKSYWDQFPKSPEIVVMYLPGESFFSAALEYDNKLIEDSSIKKVILATPTTFIALLKAIAYGWQQEQLTKNAQQISILGKELYDRMNVLTKHFGDIGYAIEEAVRAYNKAVGSMESRVLPSARKFKELGVAAAEEIPSLEQIDHTPRSLDIQPDKDK